MDDLHLGAVFFRRKRFDYFPGVLGVQFAEVDDNVLETGLLDTVGCRCYEHPRHENATTLVLGYSDVRLPGVFCEVGRAASDDALLQGVLRRSRDATVL